VKIPPLPKPPAVMELLNEYVTTFPTSRLAANNGELETNAKESTNNNSLKYFTMNLLLSS
jgi:hypothetical protein